MTIHVLLLTRSVMGSGIRSSLEQLTDWRVASTSIQHPVAIAQLAQDFNPTVTIVDDTYMTVVDLLEQLGRERVNLLGMMVAITPHPRYEETLFKLAKCGVAAYLGGGTSPEDLVATMSRVSVGEWLLSDEGLCAARTINPRILEIVQAHLVQVPTSLPVSEAEEVTVQARAPGCPLTSKEVGILVAIAQGKSNKEVAADLRTSETAVKHDIASIFMKFGVSNRTAAVVYALRKRWIRMPACPVVCDAYVRSVA
jgi:two-component system, NarL family, response regulator DegU